MAWRTVELGRRQVSVKLIAGLPVRVESEAKIIDAGTEILIDGVAYVTVKAKRIDQRWEARLMPTSQTVAQPAAAEPAEKSIAKETANGKRRSR